MKPFLTQSTMVGQDTAKMAPKLVFIMRCNNYQIYVICDRLSKNQPSSHLQFHLLNEP